MALAGHSPKGACRPEAVENLNAQHAKTKSAGLERGQVTENSVLNSWPKSLGGSRVHLLPGFKRFQAPFSG